MRHKGIIALVVAALLLGVGLGFFLTGGQPFNKLVNERKPIVEVEPVQSRVDNNTQVIYEREYQQCGHVVISEFPNAIELIGKTVDEIRQLYNEQNGYMVKIEGNTITLRQLVGDWCPQDYEKTRIKEYQGRLAVYKGPDAAHDELLRVTTIRIDVLPGEIVAAIRNGQYEFANEAMLNDALDSLDEYM
ncbi:MAG TPA: hypothetical protein DER60_11955 [Syntrophomonas sp.]|jgi:hypothetical protein|nr:hypothetical protein [Syntrophomonas sp.]